MFKKLMKKQAEYNAKNADKTAKRKQTFTDAKEKSILSQEKVFSNIKKGYKKVKKDKKWYTKKRFLIPLAFILFLLFHPSDDKTLDPVAKPITAESQLSAQMKAKEIADKAAADRIRNDKKIIEDKKIEDAKALEHRKRAPIEVTNKSLIPAATKAFKLSISKDGDQENTMPIYKAIIDYGIQIPENGTSMIISITTNYDGYTDQNHNYGLMIMNSMVKDFTFTANNKTYTVYSAIVGDKNGNVLAKKEY
ncbi:hypothetical protein LGL08_19545 [Clostridium estertheticum]|uniref:hypothetical protein n=1 Tax=Clostridium estertheticum TaxID=238834 RepID=UPI001CF3B452|nr:hypothetical protein [Clostridium estertheticum]MCB2308723.1 hypothetical protein [Clostridium estertheticum]MCB2347452.1 hypothetical protein [Clostridium estertheticum]MCB2351723.1 hypothetical protein [Clostridium estertheticum]WAG46302.1 hypothetical protein LL127_01685 [Clostridium estertheticum]